MSLEETTSTVEEFKAAVAAANEKHPVNPVILDKLSISTATWNRYLAHETIPGPLARGMIVRRLASLDAK